MRNGSQLSSICAPAAPGQFARKRTTARGSADFAQPCGYRLLQSSGRSGVERTGHVATMRPMATIEQEALVTLTESAASKIQELMAEEPEGEAGVLRIAVQGGGCSGFEYALGFDSRCPGGRPPAGRLRDPDRRRPHSAPYLQGTQIDFVDGLQGGFAINNPNVTVGVRLRPLLPGGRGRRGREPPAAAGCGSGCG